MTRREQFFWQICDPDAEPGTTFREGHGYAALLEALRDRTGVQSEHTLPGFIASGNITIYWSRKALK